MKIALILNDDFSLWRFRKGLIATLVKKGFKVYTITPGGPYVPKLRNLGAVHISVPMSRFIAPLRDLKLFWHFYRLFRKEKFDLVHNMTMKPVIYGSIAAKLAGIKNVVGLVSGAGFIFSGSNTLKLKFLKPIVVAMLKIGFRCCKKVCFQNPDDVKYFVEKKIIPENKTVLTKGSGVDLKEFSTDNIDSIYLNELKKEFNINENDIVVSMVAARLIWAKGIRQFCEAARVIQKKHVNVKFILVAPFEPDSPDSVSPGYLDSYMCTNFAVVTDFRNDVKDILAMSDIVTLPSYYREGVPRVLLEALALGKPIITTDNVGCREVVENGINGYIIPVKDSGKLAMAIEKLLIDSSMRNNFGHCSLVRAREQFDEKDVVEKIIVEAYQFN